MKKLIFLSLNWELFGVLVWTAIAAMLRFANLDVKPIWTDEFSTLVFSLGNSFQGVPLDRPISLETLLEPLKPHPNATVEDAIAHLLTESNHPPIYFAFSHYWMQMFAPIQGYVSVWSARSLAAFFGTLSVPAIYGLGYLSFRSRLVGQLAAAMMAVSPYSIYLAQEARHYTLAILLVIASLSCLIVAARHVKKMIYLPVWLGLTWIFVNSLGIAIHYFFALTLVAESLVLIAILWIKLNSQQAKDKKNNFLSAFNFSFLFPIIGTIIGSLVWLPIYTSSNYGSELTQWIQTKDRVGLAWISPIFQAFAGWITMVSLLPVESSSISVVIISGLVMVIFFIWAIPLFIRGIKICYSLPENRLEIVVLGGFILTAIALFFSFTYFLGIDLTRGARYNFVYFPAVIVLLGAILAFTFNISTVKSQFFNLPAIKISGKKAVILILLMGLFSSLTVVVNLGYQKYYKPELLAEVIQKTSQNPVLIATTHNTHVQTGEIMGIAWEWKSKKSKENLITTSPIFLLAHQPQSAPEMPTITLQKTLDKLQKPLDLWLVNFHTNVNLTAQNCAIDSRSLPFIDGYNYQLYHCFKSRE
ncbi:glycosyltransferase [Oscillatoriales cyanobacterium USR001]|nr:glycosyltransferase [Oscillatoriales cyanobacterium USR001]